MEKGKMGVGKDKRTFAPCPAKKKTKNKKKLNQVDVFLVAYYTSFFLAPIFSSLHLSNIKKNVKILIITRTHRGR